jgi:hypothetical protein
MARIDSFSQSPYKGLIPYSEADYPYFFGRSQQSRTIAANLKSSPITTLYGPSRSCSLFSNAYQLPKLDVAVIYQRNGQARDRASHRESGAEAEAVPAFQIVRAISAAPLA